MRPWLVVLAGVLVTLAAQVRSDDEVDMTEDDLAEFEFDDEDAEAVMDYRKGIKKGVCKRSGPKPKPAIFADYTLDNSKTLIVNLYIYQLILQIVHAGGT